MSWRGGIVEEENIPDETVGRRLITGVEAAVELRGTHWGGKIIAADDIELDGNAVWGVRLYRFCVGEFKKAYEGVESWPEECNVAEG